MTPRPRFGRTSLAAVSLLAISTFTTIATPATAEPSPSGTAAIPPGPAPKDVRTPGDPVAGPRDTDTRGTALPTPAQRQAVAALGELTSRWNSLGTPASLLPADGSLGAAPGDPAAAARGWLRDHAAAFGMTAAQVDGLVLVSSQKLADSPARAVLFRQDFDGVAPALGGLVTVGVADGQVAYVSSSLARTTGTMPAAMLTPLQGWLKAADDLSVGIPAAKVADVVKTVSGGWTRLSVPGFAQEQQVRLRALPMADGTVRPVLEANVVNVAGGASLAFTSLVDGVTGEVLARHNKVDNFVYNDLFQGAVDPTTGCGPQHPFDLDDDATRTITAIAAGAPVDDFVLKLFRGSTLVTSTDTATNPEALAYSAASIPGGTYSVQVCEFEPGAVILGQYAVAVSTSDTPAPGTGDLTGNPRWRYFTVNPTLDSPDEVPTNSVIGCWRLEAGCTTPPGELRNVAAFGPWDTIGPLSTLTTVGNNANTHEAWVSPLTPGGLFQAPVSPTREYTEEFTDAWNNSRCDVAELTPGGNDINASVGNLFVAHNRMHDFSYYLGFTEENYNLQFDNGSRGGVGGDQEVGNAQAGAVTGGSPTFQGRDNANQIALQDGVPGITNQYLFEPIAGAFYAPCTDGGLDMGIVGHEYTHAISNRMVGGPDEGLTSEQGGAMGESWGDLVAGEYQFAHGYSNGGNVWAVGAYATGNTDTAIRDYSIDQNPLNYSDYGFDTTGPEVHADGEIWNGTMWEVRQALVEKYDAQFPYDDTALQLACADATAAATPRSADACPGNRRWVQLMFDAFLLQQGATSMLDARDAMIAADQMRFGGADKDVMWAAFARRGMGAGASVVDADDSEPTPSFATPTGPNSTITFATTGRAKIYVGDYEARVSPVADTDPTTPLGAGASFTPGTYDMVAVSPDRGFTRWTMTVLPDGQARTETLGDVVNLASAAAGGSVIGSTDGSLNPEALIDGTEQTNWGGVTEAQVDESNPSVAVDLAGGVQTVRRVQVSAYLTPAPASATDVPLAQDDPDSGSRFTALRQFALEACTASCDSPDATWTRFYTSPADAFPSGLPRPVAPTLNMREFDVPDTEAAAVRLVTLENQCTGQEAYAGDQTASAASGLPTAVATDCKTGSDRGTIVHASELQVFGESATTPTQPTTGGGSGAGSGTGTGTGTGTGAGTGTGTGSGTTTTTGAARTKIRMIVKRAFQTTQKPAPVLFLAVRSAVEKEAGTFVVRVNKRKYTAVATADGTARIKVRKSRLQPGRNTVRVRFAPTDPSTFASSRTRLRRITVERTG
ncbi:M36 family metallopeptidase [Nocardioides KLBMP 9356]|uniref:M36 family metallopeptidase n=1 Tax=Nocardioides potassii TaxID=2911371 RepID=A0ABS9HHD3_9ACTN|nr:M36 family metallopeptidase [Nocardioides potassii]MCF6379669.1 M36 family metallopeptidase [Nocardioides potassii]